MHLVLLRVKVESGVLEACREPNMAAFQIVPPTPFDFKCPEGWPNWIWRFERFLESSKLNVAPESRQVATLIYYLGDEAEDILVAANLTKDDKKKYGTVKKIFEDYFVGQRNLFYERAEFHRRKQKPGETVDAFLTALHALIETCAYPYPSLKDELVLVRFVVGLLDAKVSEALQLDSKLTLETALEKAKMMEVMKGQQNFIRAEESSTLTMGEMKLGRREQQERKPGNASSSGQPGPGNQSETITCGCGEIAIELTVTKDGPTKGRQFYKCAKQADSGCNYFAWKDAEESSNVRTNPPPDDGVTCNCALPARKATVQKDSPNKGRLYHTCSKFGTEKCGFFQWYVAVAGPSGNNNSRGRVVKQPARRRKCGHCGRKGHNVKTCPNRDHDHDHDQSR